MSRKRNVLVVDDDRVAHLLSEKVLTSFSWLNKIYKAFNGKEGLQVLNDYCQGLISPPDLILLDLHMPVMDGFQFIQEFKQMKCLEAQGIVTVVLSSTINPKEIERVKELGIRHHITKPISYDLMLSVILQESYSVL
jgi:CheY-like chemotaxis protein